MRFESPLEAVTLLKRYKRFLADVRRADGSLLTVHVPNSGSMKTCVGDDWPALISDSGNPSRKYRHTLEMVHNGTCWIGVNTSRANALALEALTSGAIPGFADWDDWRGEVRYGENSRIDLLARRGELLCYVEVKNVSLLDGEAVAFPDAVTSRGLKHLHDLMREAERGQRAVLLLTVQRADGAYFRPADSIDPAWCAGLREAVARGVEVIAWRFDPGPEGILPTGPVEIRL